MKKGFTLIELLVAIAIIAILSAIGLVIYSNIQVKARDGKRKADLRSIQQALEIYYQKNDHYPCVESTSGWLFSSAGQFWIQDQVTGGTGSNCGSGGTLNETYINPMPTDPRGNSSTTDPLNAGGWQGYAYWAQDPDDTWRSGCPQATGQYFVLTTRLENTSDPDRHQERQYLTCDGFPFTAHNNAFIITSQY